MNHLLFAFVGLLAATEEPAADGTRSVPATQPQELPPHQRLLKGEDAEKVKELEQELAQLQEAGKFSAAIQPAEQILEIRARIQGADHWQTVDARCELELCRTLRDRSSQDQLDYALSLKVRGDARKLYTRGRYTDADPLFRRVLEIRRRVLNENHLEVATSYHDVAFNLGRQGKYREAELLAQRTLEIRRRILGEDHPDTANAYNSVAFILDRQGKYVQAEPLYRQALEIRCRVLGEDHPLTAASYNNVATNLNDQGKFDAAEPIFRQTLAIFSRVLGEDNARTATIYNNLASNLDNQGKYTDAESLHRKALDIRTRVLGAEHEDTAVSYGNIAQNLEHQGKHATAEILCRRALEIHMRVLGEENQDTATSYNNLASNLDHQGKYAEAEPLSRHALEITRRLLGEEHPDMAIRYNNVAMNLKDQGKFAEAELLFRQSLALNRRLLGDEHPDTAVSYNNLASNLADQGRYAEAVSLQSKALEHRIGKLGEDPPDTLVSYANVGSTLDDQGKYAEAEPLHRKALELRIGKLGEDHPDTAISYKNRAYNLYAQGRYEECEEMLSIGALKFDTMRARISFSGLDRATLAARYSPLELLSAAQARRDKPADAWRHLEASLARGLLDDLSARQLRPLTAEEQASEHRLVRAIDQVDERLGATTPAAQSSRDAEGQLDALRKQRDRLVLELRQFEQAITEKYGVAGGQVYDLQTIQKQLPPDTALLGWVDIQGKPRMADPNGDHWACVVRHQGEPVWIKLPGSGPDGAWINEDDSLPDQVRKLVGDRTKQSDPGWRKLVDGLYRQRLQPVERSFNGDPQGSASGQGTTASSSKPTRSPLETAEKVSG